MNKTNSSILDEEPFFKKLGVNPEEYRSLKVSTTLFSNRTYNCLMRGNISTFETLLKKSEKTLLEIPSLGRQTLSEIKDGIVFVIKNGNCSFSSVESDNIDSSNAFKKHTKPSDDLVVCKEIRSKIYNHITQIDVVDCSTDVSIDDCMIFCEHLKEWAKQLIIAIPSISDRDKEIQIHRIVNGETLYDAGKSFNLSRERVRQICNKNFRRVLARVIRFPDSKISDRLEALDGIIASTNHASLYVFLNYVLSENVLLFNFFFQIIIPSRKRNTILCEIRNAPPPIGKKRLSN